jgi:hypothetical protein
MFENFHRYEVTLVSIHRFGYLSGREHHRHGNTAFFSRSKR